MRAEAFRLKRKAWNRTHGAIKYKILQLQATLNCLFLIQKSGAVQAQNAAWLYDKLQTVSTEGQSLNLPLLLSICEPVQDS